MRPPERDLIERLKERNADRARATDDSLHPPKRMRPATPRALVAAEGAIGFALPALLRAVYLGVANGGFGPEYGLMGTKGGARLDGQTLETCYRELLDLDQENPVWRWPKGLLAVANYGCGMWACVDCEYARLPMILWDPNNLDSELDGADARLNWGNAFWDQGRSFASWLEGWLDGTPEPEPKWPSDAWMKKRLGFTLPK